MSFLLQGRERDCSLRVRLAPGYFKLKRFALFIGFLMNGLNLHGVSPHVQTISIGLVIGVAASLDILSRLPKARWKAGIMDRDRPGGA